MIQTIQRCKELYKMDLESYMFLNSSKFKEMNKEKIANGISYFHIFLLLYTICSFMYQDERLHKMNLFLQLCNYTDWFYNGYNVDKYGAKEECIITRLENSFRILDSRQKEKEYKENKENKENNEKSFKKYSPKDGYIREFIKEKLGFVLPKVWVNIIIHSMAGASLYNSWNCI